MTSTYLVVLCVFQKFSGKREVVHYPEQCIPGISNHGFGYFPAICSGMMGICYDYPLRWLSFYCLHSPLQSWVALFHSTGQPGMVYVTARRGWAFMACRISKCLNSYCKVAVCLITQWTCGVDNRIFEVIREFKKRYYWATGGIPFGLGIRNVSHETCLILLGINRHFYFYKYILHSSWFVNQHQLHQLKGLTNQIVQIKRDNSPCFCRLQIIRLPLLVA